MEHDNQRALLEGIFDRLSRIDQHLDKLNSKVAEQQGTIREWTPAMDGQDDRFRSLEECIDELQREVDQARGVRDAALRDLAEVRGVVSNLQDWMHRYWDLDKRLHELNEVQLWIADQKGDARARARDLALAFTLIGQLVVLAKLFILRN